MTHYKKWLLTIGLALTSIYACAQTQDEESVSQIFKETLTAGKTYPWLEYLTTKIGARLSGSPGAARAVEWTRQELLNIADTVWLQPVMVPHWVRGEQEEGRIIFPKKKNNVDVAICALGGSVGTGPEGITASVIEVKSFEELKELGEHHIKGKIIFFNRPMDKTVKHTFTAYAGAVNQRALGPSEAARYGAVAVIVRSMGLNPEPYPHTGSLVYADGVPRIPAVAISTNDAEVLSQTLKKDKDLRFYLETHCETLADVQSFNVVAELRGTEYRDEIIVVGAHLDSWDLAQGAHDDGAGCVQAMEVMRLFKILGITPRRTIRVVLFMNEENGLRGGTEYARLASIRNENHVAAIEADEGGFTPRGFSMTASTAFRDHVKSWKPLLEPYGLTDFDHVGGGADISPLESRNIPLIGYMPDSQRYFDYHHTREDTFDKVSKRELELGAGAMAALVFLLDKYGVK